MSAPAARAILVMAATSGRVPITLLAALTATTAVRDDSSSPNCAAGSSPVAVSTSAQRITAPAPAAARSPGPARARGRPPRRDIRVMVEPGHDHLVSRPPAGRQGACQPVSQGGHARPEDHAVRTAASQVRQRPAALGSDRVGPPAGREGTAGVSESGPVGIADGADHRDRQLSARRAVQIGESVPQGRVLRTYPAYLKDHLTSSLTVAGNAVPPGSGTPVG